MTHEPFKVVLRYQAMSVPVCKITGFPFEHPHLEANRYNAASLIKRAKDWLSAQARACYYLMAYDNTDHAEGVGEIIIVLNDRDTALLLKLSLG